MRARRPASSTAARSEGSSTDVHETRCGPRPTTARGARRTGADDADAAAPGRRVDLVILNVEVGLITDVGASAPARGGRLRAPEALIGRHRIVGAAGDERRDRATCAREAGDARADDHPPRRPRLAVDAADVEPSRAASNLRLGVNQLRRRRRRRRRRRGVRRRRLAARTPSRAPRGRRRRRRRRRRVRRVGGELLQRARTPTACLGGAGSAKRRRLAAEPTTGRRLALFHRRLDGARASCAGDGECESTRGTAPLCCAAASCCIAWRWPMAWAIAEESGTGG